MKLLAAITENTSMLDTAWTQVSDLWANPDTQPILVMAVVVGVILGLALAMLRRRVWLAIKPRSIEQNSRG
jgi:uncharacterized protein involved in exopolysaccharide biosynthesis